MPGLAILGNFYTNKNDLNIGNRYLQHSANRVYYILANRKSNDNVEIMGKPCYLVILKQIMK
jgi:hypothetical protein